MLNWCACSYYRIRQQYHDITEGFSPDYMLVDLAELCRGGVEVFGYFRCFCTRQAQYYVTIWNTVLIPQSSASNVGRFHF